MKIKWPHDLKHFSHSRLFGNYKTCRYSPRYWWCAAHLPSNTRPLLPTIWQPTTRDSVAWFRQGSTGPQKHTSVGQERVPAHFVASMSRCRRGFLLRASSLLCSPRRFAREGAKWPRDRDGPTGFWLPRYKGALNWTNWNKIWKIT
jgi:hypothetical protein